MVSWFTDGGDLVVEILEGVLDFTKETFLVVLLDFLLLSLVFLELVLKEVVRCHGFIVTKDHIVTGCELPSEKLVGWLRIFDCESKEVCLLFLFAYNGLRCVGFNLLKESINRFLLLDFLFAEIHVKITKIVKCIWIYSISTFLKTIRELWERIFNLYIIESSDLRLFIFISPSIHQFLKALIIDVAFKIQFILGNSYTVILNIVSELKVDIQ